MFIKIKYQKRMNAHNCTNLEEGSRRRDPKHFVQHSFREVWTAPQMLKVISVFLPEVIQIENHEIISDRNFLFIINLNEL